MMCRDGGGPVQTHSHRGAGGRNGGIACPMVREVAGNSTPLTCACLHPNQGDIIYGDQVSVIRLFFCLHVLCSLRCMRLSSSKSKIEIRMAQFPCGTSS